ncbi:hypothetical protein B0H21DRAFT_699487 [Amylocystis lapponica]|nr:hypothetical protein B0H21DRAFT_699487 [Amylocystis lapponica]
MEGLAREEMGRRGMALREAEVRLRAQDGQLSALRAQMHDLGVAAAERETEIVRERERMQALSVAQQAELRDARRYLSAPDSLGDTDIVRMMGDLNLEITRMATHLTESFHSEEHRGGEAVQAAYERTREAVGPIMAELLESIQHQDDPILIQIALQADMASFAAGIVSAWDFQHQSNAVFSGIYRQMLRSETQAMCGRWRALTRQYSKQRLYAGRDLAAGFAHQLADRVADLLLIAGSSVSAEQLRETSGESLEQIVRLALDLQRAIGEEIVGCDYEVVLARVDDVFDPQQMADVYSAGLDESAPAADKSAELHVLCTVELGVRRCEKADESVPDETRKITLLRPKVVLETLVYELGLVEEDESLAEGEEQ